MNHTLNSHLSPFQFKPLSRRSIHANCTFPCYCKMVRYGIDKDNDECDSVSIPRRRREQSDRSFGTINNEYYEDIPRLERRQSEGFDEVDNIASIRLSTSLPAKHRFHPHYSYNDDVSNSESSINQNLLLSSEESQNSFDSSETLEESSRKKNNRKRSRSRLGSVKPNYAAKNVNKDKNSYGTIISVLSLCICGLLVYLIYNESSTKLVYDEENFINDLHQLSQTYPINDDELLKLQSGIITISQREDAGSFIFIYDSTSSKYNENLFNNFVDNIATLSVRFLRNKSSETKPVIPSSLDLTLPEHAALVSLHREGVTQSGVMLVHAVSRVPARLASAFHYYCDEYNPLVKKSAVFFTLDVADCPSGQSHNTQHSFVENCLSKSWKALPIDHLGPLLTRVVNVVVDLQR